MRLPQAERAILCMELERYWLHVQVGAGLTVPALSHPGLPALLAQQAQQAQQAAGGRPAPVPQGPAASAAPAMRPAAAIGNNALQQHPVRRCLQPHLLLFYTMILMVHEELRRNTCAGKATRPTASELPVCAAAAATTAISACLQPAWAICAGFASISGDLFPTPHCLPGTSVA